MFPFFSFFTAHPLWFYSTLCVLGLLIGSFLNVVIYRLPRMILSEESEAHATFNLAWPGSHCPHCQHAIAPLDNIPLLSFILRRGRCRHCYHAISWRYPLVEVLTASLTLLAGISFGMNLQLLCVLLFLWGLIALFFIDLDSQLLPDSLTQPLLWLGLLANMQGLFTDLHSALWGAVGGYLALASVTWIYALCTKKVGMGQGDFKLLAALGAWLGWQLLPYVILLSSVLGLVTGLIILRCKRQGFQTPIAFGPYLIAAGVFFLWHKSLLW